MSRASLRKIVPVHLLECWRIYAVFAGLALLILAPLLRPGYISTLDMVFTPRLRMPASVGNVYLFRGLLHILNFALPGDVIEKLLIFAVLWLSGVGMYQLARDLGNKQTDVYMRLGCHFAGIIYMINPFTYDRWMSGQYLVLFGYALLPWFVRALLRFVLSPGWRRALVLLAWTIAVSIVSIHAIGFMALLAGISIGSALWRHRDDDTAWRPLLKYSLAVLAGFVLLSSYWLAPLALGHGTTAGEISGFTSTDQAAFATLGGSVIGQIGNVLRLQGFWAEGQGLYNLPQAHAPLWGLMAVLVWALVVGGGVSMWRSRQRSVVIVLGLSALIAAVLAIGTLNDWLAAHVPLFAGYREPQKFVVLIALAYAAFAARGFAELLRYMQREGSTAFCALIGAVILLLPLAWTPTMLWGFDRQLSSSQYPSAWATVNAKLDAAPGNFKVLFLPWHLYLYYGFAGRLIADPAPQYFDRPVVSGNNPEFRNIGPVPNTVDSSVGTLLAAAPHRTDLGKRLAAYHIKYVLVAHEGDYANYGYLYHQAGLQVIFSSPSMTVFRNQAYGGSS